MTEIVLIFGTLGICLFTSTAFAFLSVAKGRESQRRH